MPFPANPVMNYLHNYVHFVAYSCIWLAAARIKTSNIRTPRTSASSLWLSCQVPSFLSQKLCPTAIKLQTEWLIPWTLCRVFTSYIPLLRWYHCYYTRPRLRLTVSCYYNNTILVTGYNYNTYVAKILPWAHSHCMVFCSYTYCMHGTDLAK